MKRRIVTYMIAVAMMVSTFCFPAASHGTTEGGETPAPQVAKAAGVKAKGIDSKTIRLKWKKVANATGYQIYRYSHKYKKYRQIHTTAKRSYKNKNLKADTRYTYRVRAYVKQDGKTYFGPFSKAAKSRTKKSDAQKVVSKARSKIGAAYKSGGEGPRAFDCSGFVYWVYNNADVKPKKKIKRTSSAGLYHSLKKYKVGSSYKSVKKAKAGDIILFTRGGSYGHAAIYAGKGRIIHAANPRKGVVSQSIRQLHNSGTRVATIVRVVD